MKFNCPHCQNVLAVPDNAAGRTGTCPKCGRKVRVSANGTSVGSHGTAGSTRVASTQAIARHASVSVPPRKGSEYWNVPTRHTTLPETGNKHGGQKPASGLKWCCLLVVFLLFVLMVIGGLASSSNSGRQAEGEWQTAENDSDDDEWEDYYGFDSEENAAKATYAITEGTNLGDGTIMLPDGRILNMETGKVKRKR